jgi:hypothetical protein
MFWIHFTCQLSFIIPAVILIVFILIVLQAYCLASLLFSKLIVFTLIVLLHI